MSAAVPAHTGPRLFDSPWQAVRDLAAVTRRAKSLTAVYGRGRLDGASTRAGAAGGQPRERLPRLHVSSTPAGPCAAASRPTSAKAIELGDLGRLDRRSRAAVVYATALAQTRFRSSPPDVAALVAAELAPAEIEAVEAVARMMALANLTASTAQALLGRLRLRRR